MTADLSPIKPSNEIAAELEGKVVPTNDLNEPKDCKEYAFDFEYKDLKGKVWKGKFKNRILTIHEQQRVQVIKAHLSGNLSMSALDNRMWYLNSWIAHLTISLIERPDWAKELTDLYDDLIIEKLFEEVASHEAQFCGRSPYYSMDLGSTEDKSGES